MKINIKRYFLPLAAVLFMVGCHEAVEPEAIDVNYSSFEETNPELYARYMQALREYKAGSHKAVFVTMTVPETAPRRPIVRSILRRYPTASTSSW